MPEKVIDYYKIAVLSRGLLCDFKMERGDTLALSEFAPITLCDERA
jgi:hypothetical protein